MKFRSFLCVVALLGVAYGRFLLMKTPPAPHTAAPDRVPQAGEAVVLFGAGCFWGVEAAFAKVPGVKGTSVGYAGGHTSEPTYEDVCGHTTGHAEVVRVVYDPAEVSFEVLLEIFWAKHDPSVPRKTGPAEGGQYRSAIFYTTDEQAKTAREAVARLNASGRYGRSIATEIAEAPPFWRAEDYHQQYYLRGAVCRLP